MPRTSRAQEPDKASPQQDCALHVIATLDMQTIPDGRVTIPVQFEGHDHRLMVDTGGYISTVTPLLATEEGYKTHVSHGTILKGMGTSLLNSYVETTDFSIGHSHGRNFDFFVDEFNDLSLDGTLAPSILAAYDIDFDFAHDKINLIDPDHCPGRVTYWTKIPPAIVPLQIQNQTHIRIPVMVDGKEIMATVDTGSATSYITMRAATRFLGINDKSDGLKSRGIVTVNGMPGPVYNYPFQALTFGNVTVNRPHVEIVSDPVWSEDDLLLGIGILRQLHFYIAYREKKLYITPAQAN
ncbi:MAG TPA: retropepsin-like aspartic protease [Rhizomicrobium sp.]|jgi:predicted aspartyl protease|nr:retropepsin-like aspartic protease [Rhizomicrobium sp.]